MGSDPFKNDKSQVDKTDTKTDKKQTNRKIGE